MTRVFISSMVVHIMGVNKMYVCQECHTHIDMCFYEYKGYRYQGCQ